MRLAFLGTPGVAVPPMRALVEDGHEVRLVVTRADKRRGRGGALMPSPVKAAAQELGLTVTDQVDDVIDAGAELGVVVAFGRLIKPHVLAALPMVNVHFSLLPRWRGAAPLERAILAGDAETGVCLMELEEGLDTGPVYACERVPIGPEETAAELRTRLVDAGTHLLVQALRTGLGTPAPQEGEPTYADKIDPAEHHIDWTRPAVEVHRVVRVGDAWTTFRGKRLKVLRALLSSNGLAPGAIDGLRVGAGDGALELVEVQPEGKAAMPASAWVNGAHPRSDERLGE
ncbi:MAG: methionyl-tRNA formyltransferase [Acidimicrobiia bacterium]|nr:methionyl-tRNA formyltransferase [Acidimicrobiia bacterium]